MGVVHYTQCPVCGAGDLKEALQVKDHSVSGETFPVLECGRCTLRFTDKVPDAGSISPYYKSEDYISHTNTSKGLINRLYQWVRKRTLRKKRRQVQRLTGINSGQLLDVGSGTGAFVQQMEKHGWQVTGLEPDPDARKVAEEVNGVKLSDINIIHDLPAGRFDAITMWHVLEHVHDLQSYIAKLKDLLKDNGRLFIAVPNYTCRDAVVYGSAWAAWDVPRHLYHFSPASMQALIDRHGLTITGHLPMWYDSFYISMLSSKYKNGKMNLPGAFLNGLLSNLKATGDVKRCSSVIYVISK